MIDLLLRSIKSKNTSLSNETPDFETKIESLRELAIKKYPDIRRANDGKVAGNISETDARLLYNIVLYQRPKTIFEIGTWIGTSSMVMADALKVADLADAKIYTCDKNNYYCLSSEFDERIVRINQFSDEAIDLVPDDRKIDMVFADGELTVPTLKKLLPRLSDEVILVTHDYTLPGEKGVSNLIRIQMKCRGRFVYVLPSKEDKCITSIGLLLPKTIAVKFEITSYRQVLRYMYTIYLFCKTNIYLLFRKLYRELSSAS